MAQKINIQVPTTKNGYVQIPKYKIIVLGPMASGKTALSLRFCENKFRDTQPTIGLDYRQKILKIDNQSVWIQLWDTAGQERFAESLTPSFYRGVDGVVFVFDITSRISFKQVNFWINQCNNFVDAETPMILVGTKCDMTAAVSANEARIFAGEQRFPYFTTSAKDNEEASNVTAIFKTLALKMKEKRPLIRPQAIQLDHTMVVDPPASLSKRMCSWC